MATHSSILPGTHGQRSLARYSSWDLKELDMTEQQQHDILYPLGENFILKYHYILKGMIIVKKYNFHRKEYLDCHS